MMAALIIAGTALFPVAMIAGAYFAAGPPEQLPGHRKNPETRR